MRDLNGDIDLGELACGKVRISTDLAGNTVAAGFVGTEQEMAQVQNALMDKVDTIDVALAPWPACEARLTLDDAINERPAAGRRSAGGPALAMRSTIGIETHGFPSYLYAAAAPPPTAYVNIAQPNSSDLRPKAGHTIVRFGDAESSRCHRRCPPPVGDEIAIRN